MTQTMTNAHYAMIVAVDKEGQPLMKPCKVTNEQLPDWATGHLFTDDLVVIESTTNAWHVYDLLAPLVAEVKVANPIRCNGRDMLISCPLGTWAGAQEGKGFQNTKAFSKDTPALAFRCKCRGDVDTRLARSESRISFGTSSMTIAFAKPLDWKGSVVAVLLPTAWVLRSGVKRKFHAPF